jgi:sterol 14alpha-demethylase
MRPKDHTHEAHETGAHAFWPVSRSRISEPTPRRPPRLGGGFPVLGHMAALGRDPVGLLSRVRTECGDVGSFRILSRRMVLLSGPAAQEAFFHAPNSVLSPKDAYQKMMTPIFGKGIIYDAPSLDIMSEHIAMTYPALTERRLRRYLELIVREVDLSLAEWEESGELDVLSFAQELMLRTAAATLMGPEIRERLSSEFAPLYHDLERGITPIVFVLPRLPIPAFRRRDAALKRLQGIFAELVADRRRTGRKGEDFLQTLMDAQGHGIVT